PIEIKLTETGHFVEGAAVTLHDGSTLYCFQGLLLPSNVLENPSTITPGLISRFHRWQEGHITLIRLYLGHRYQIADLLSPMNDDTSLVLYDYYQRRLRENYKFTLPVEENACLIDERPVKLSFDDRGWFHCEDGPALVFQDGEKWYAWHGIILNAEFYGHLIEDPGSISINGIENERNIEIRRVMVERFGAERYLKESDAKAIQSDKCGTLFWKQMEGDEPLVMVRVKNSTPEPDGSYKDYFLRVPPNITTAREGVAWTFGLSSSEYVPAEES
ncbi:MAG: hypothetical protein K2Z81_08585, partial [Cyanobacteria bacterium]|nr:hypothetical protein [Cyanobacteriota bacterium]